MSVRPGMKSGSSDPVIRFLLGAGAITLRLVSRIAVCLAFAAVWLTLSLVFVSMTAPESLGDDDIRNKGIGELGRNGVGVDLRISTLRELLILVTAFHFIPLLPYTLIPYGEARRVTWLSWISFGWMSAVLGSILVLYSRRSLEVTPTDAFVSKDILGGTVAGLALIGLITCWLVARRTLSAVLASVLLLVGCLRAEGEIFGSVDLFGLSGKVTGSFANWLPLLVGNGLSGGLGQGLLLLGMFGIVLLAIAIATAGDFESFTQSAGLAMMIVTLIAVAAICIGMLTGRVEYVPDDSFGIFSIGIGVVAVAPFWGFLGSPASERNRLVWLLAIALTLAALFVVLHQPELWWKDQPSLAGFWHRRVSSLGHLTHRLWLVP
jgi:hypothetical protein